MVRQTTWGAPGRISLRNGARYLLRQLGLVLVEEPDRLLITTPEGVDSRLTTEVYPVADLMFTDRTTPPWLLVNPYLDQQQRARQRLESKLKRKLTIEYREQPLDEVIADLGGKLGEIILIDDKSLDDIGVGFDSPVSASFHDVPAKRALEWILDDLGLDYTLHDEALIITTAEEAESHLDIRVHSVRDLVYEFPSSRRGCRRNCAGEWVGDRAAGAQAGRWLAGHLAGWAAADGAGWAAMGGGGGAALGAAAAVERAAGWGAWAAPLSAARRDRRRVGRATLPSDCPAAATRKWCRPRPRVNLLQRTPAQHPRRLCQALRRSPSSPIRCWKRSVTASTATRSSTSSRAPSRHRAGTP